MPTSNCLFCNALISEERYITADGGFRQFCSKSCAMKYRIKHNEKLKNHFSTLKTGVVANCEGCGKEIYRTVTDIKHNEKRFCNRDCYIQTQVQWNDGKTKETDVRVMNQAKNLSETLKTKYAMIPKKEVNLICEFCNKSFIHTIYRKYCSEECIKQGATKKVREYWSSKPNINSRRIGDIAQYAIVLNLLKKQKNILIPIGEDHRYDIVLEENGKFSRIQCKTGKLKNGCVEFPQFSTTAKKQARYYTKEEIDYFGVYCMELDKCYLIPCESTNTKSLLLRIDPPKNNQKSGITWAKNYEI